MRPGRASRHQKIRASTLYLISGVVFIKRAAGYRRGLWGGGSEDENAIIRIFWVGEMEKGPWNVGIDRCPLAPPLAAYTLRASQDETRQKE
jgi:hypothetical protein